MAPKKLCCSLGTRVTQLLFVCSNNVTAGCGFMHRSVMTFGIIHQLMPKAVALQLSLRPYDLISGHWQDAVQCCLYLTWMPGMKGLHRFAVL